MKIYTIYNWKDVDQVTFQTQRIKTLSVHAEQFVSMDRDSMIILSIVVYQDNMAMV